MENWYFILVPVVLIVIVLTFKFFKMEEDYREKSMEIQQKIEELKLKNSSLNKIKGNTIDMQNIHHQVLELHKKIVNNHLK
jgi:hypothetical protein